MTPKMSATQVKRAKHRKYIVLPEGNDDRTLTRLLSMDVVDILFFGSKTNRYKA
jgi:hypothetical protein